MPARQDVKGAERQNATRQSATRQSAMRQSTTHHQAPERNARGGQSAKLRAEARMEMQKAEAGRLAQSPCSKSRGVKAAHVAV